MLYGIPPEGNELPQLQPAMTFNSRVFAVRSLQPGEPVGYGATYIAERPMRVGLVCAGYADGYPQTARSGTPIAVDGRRTSLVGRVSMDMLIADLTELPDAAVDSEVELWGRTIRVSEVAAAAGRIPYELVCNVRRAPIVYRDAESGESEQEIALQFASNQGVRVG
jgi:alanine racemase